MKPWLGTFEEELYEKFTTGFKVDRRLTRTKNRKCLRCDDIFKSLENRICNSCKRVNERKEDFEES